MLYLILFLRTAFNKVLAALTTIYIYKYIHLILIGVAIIVQTGKLLYDLIDRSIHLQASIFIKYQELK